MKSALKTLFVLAALAGLLWVAWPYLWPRVKPQVDRFRGAEPVKVREFNPLR